MNEKILQKLSLISIFILICGIVKLNIYYLLFEININEYIDLSEFTVLFIDDLLFYFLCFISPIIYLLFAYGVNYTKNKTGFEFFHTKFGFLIVIVFSIYYLVKDFDDYSNNWISMKVNVIVVICSVIIIIKDFNINESKKTLYKIPFLLIFTFSIIDPIVDVEQLKNGKLNKEIEITFNDNLKVRTNYPLSFIGRTKSFIFLYDIRANSTLVYKFSYNKWTC